MIFSRKPKKAQGMPVNVIVIAAIALVVLGILGYILMSSTGKFTKSVSACEEKGGICAKACGTGNAKDHPIISSSGCYDKDKKYHSDYVCCISPN